MGAKVDDVLEAVGAMGKFQWIVIFITGFNSQFVGIHFLVIVFHSQTPNFRCALPSWPNDTYQPFSDLHNESIYNWIPPDKDGKLDSCKIYTSNSSNITTECNQYIFDQSEYWGTSLNMQFGMVCSHSIVAITTKVVFTIGLVVGAGLTGILADRFGRKITMVGSLLLGGVCCLIAAFSVNIIMFAALRFAIGACFVGVILVNNVVCIEFAGPSRRAYCVAARNFFWPVGTILISIIAYYLQDWNWFQLATSIPAFILAVITMIFLPETPHFLMSKGKHEELSKVFKKMARINNKPVPDMLIEDLKEDEQAAVSEKLSAILKAPVLLKRFAVFLYLWLITGMGFYGLSFNVANLTGNVYINNAISGAVELPAAAAIFLAQKVGRKVLTITPLFVGSIALISSAVMNVYLDVERYSYILIAVSMIGKFAISLVFTMDYFWSSEMYPSTLRTTMVGVCSLFARVGSMLSPIIADLYQIVPTIFGAGLGPLIFGITMFIGGVLTFYLPETNQQKVPETIEESNNFLTGNKRHVKPEDEFTNSKTVEDETAEL